MVTKKILIISLCIPLHLLASEAHHSLSLTPSTSTVECDADLKKLVDELDDLCLRTRHPVSPFWHKKSAKIKEFLTKHSKVHPDFIRYHTASSEKDRPLHEAVIHQDVELVHLLLERGASVKQEEHEDPLLLSSERLDLTELLLKHKADINAQDTIGNNALFKVPKPDVIKFFSDNGIDATHCNNAGETPLYYLTFLDLDKINAFIGIGVPVDLKRGSDHYYSQSTIPAIANGIAATRGLTLIQQLQVQIADKDEGYSEPHLFLQALKTAVASRRALIRQNLRTILPNDLAHLALAYYELEKLEFTPEELASRSSIFN